jgi:thiol-disulfide isomerase/thioredoxin
MFGTLLVTLNAWAASPASGVWGELAAKREKLPGVHQEFEVSQTSTTAHGGRSMKRQIIIDFSAGRWRERSVSGSGSYIRIFDGQDLFFMEEGGGEFVRTKHRSKDEDPAPNPYHSDDAEWPKAVELGRRPCGIPGNDHTCVILEAPLKKWTQVDSNRHVTKMAEGSERILLDTETGLILSLRSTERIDNLSGSYRSETALGLTNANYGAIADAGLFRLPSDDMREVKELSKWDAPKIKKQMAGKAAPELVVTDIQGKPVALSSYKGKTVLLDFWTTWCPPCRQDGPALDKLYSKYGDKDLMIVGVSVSEEREIVEKFLKEHPHTFPVVLTTENEMPRPYQIGVFPTYIVIEKDGTVAAAAQGDQGFGELRAMLRKAGLEVD